MSKGLASTQGGNEATGALQAGGDVEHTKLNSSGQACCGPPSKPIAFYANFKADQVHRTFSAILMSFRSHSSWLALVSTGHQRPHQYCMIWAFSNGNRLP